MTPLAALVAASERIAATASRTAKVRELAALLKQLAPDEIDIAVHYLSGELPQGPIGVGGAALRSAAGEAAALEARLSVLEVDRLIRELGALRGTGSAQRRETALRALFAQATLAEQHFLLRLLAGELRQGALA